jgi:hypothetical protein
MDTIPHPVSGRWHLQIPLNGGFASIYEDPNEPNFSTESRAWEVARNCYPDTEHLSAMVRVVFIPD